MNRQRNFWVALLAAAAAALAAVAGTASATTLTSPTGTGYTGTIAATAASASMQGDWTPISCKHSSLEGSVESHGASVTVVVKLSTLAFSECNYQVTVLKPGTLEIHGSGAVTSSGTEIALHTSVGQCVYGTSNSTFGTLTGGTPATLDYFPAKFFRSGGSFLCGSSTTWGAGYTFTAPGSLWVD